MKALRALLLSVLFITSFESWAATTYYAVCNCNWTGSSTWSTTQNGAGSALPTLVAGDILVISGYTVTVDAQITINPQITINLISASAAGAILKFQTGNKLTLTSASSVINLTNTNSSLYPKPQIDPGGGGGNSNYISIGGNNVWNAGDGVVSGVGQLNTNSRNGSLPITLVSFSASLNDNYIELNWATASELNFDYFDLQRSANGTTFESIAHINGHGTSNQEHEYSYLDKSPFVGNNYYRLVSVDFDNHQETFDIVWQKYTGTKQISIYPNPSSGSNLNIELNFIHDTNGQIAIINNLGYSIANYPVEGDKVSLAFSTPLVPGTYLAKYTSTSYTETIRFIVK